MPAWQLPTFSGYTVDLRLGQFRKAEPGKPLEFIDFDSHRGVRLLARWGREEPDQVAATVEHYRALGVPLKIEWLILAGVVNRRL
jgi:hypothetical protein